MGLKKLLWRWLGQHGAIPRSSQTGRARLTLERLEDRAVPASFTAATVGDLLTQIAAANRSAEADTIALAPGTTFTLKQVNNTAYGAHNGLPVIAASGGPLRILGNGGVIERSTARKTPAFRLFAVEPGASLTLENLTLQGGSAFSNGGAIYNAGTLTLNGVTVQKNVAQGDLHTAGGGIYSTGSLTLQDCLVQNNQALGGDGTPATKGSDHDGGWDYSPGTDGGWGRGGGVCIAGGTATLLRTTVTDNTAKGGQGGAGRYGQPAGNNGLGAGGGVYIASGASVSLDAFTVDHVMSNLADIYPDIYGVFTTI